MKKLVSVFAMTILLFSLVNGQEDEPYKMKPALLIIDMQKAFMPMMSQADQDRALEMMNWSMWAFREAELPVIRVYHTSPDWGVVEGADSFEFHDSLKISKDDPMVIKTYGSSFTKTNLDEILKEKGINTLFMCGLSAVGCVLATYMDASSHDYKAFLIKDAMLSHDENYTNQIEDIFGALDLDTVMFMLKIGKE